MGIATVTVMVMATTTNTELEKVLGDNNGRPAALYCESQHDSTGSAGVPAS